MRDERRYGVMDYTKEMTTSEICLELAKMRIELLNMASAIEKIAKNIAYLDDVKGGTE